MAICQCGASCILVKLVSRDWILYVTSHTACPQMVYPLTVCPHMVYPHTVCPHTVYPQMIYPHMVCSHMVYPHTVCPHTVCPQTVCPHIFYSHISRQLTRTLLTAHVDNSSSLVSALLHTCLSGHEPSPDASINAQHNSSDTVRVHSSPW